MQMCPFLKHWRSIVRGYSWSVTDIPQGDIPRHRSLRGYTSQTKASSSKNMKLKHSWPSWLLVHLSWSGFDKAEEDETKRGLSAWKNVFIWILKSIYRWTENTQIFAGVIKFWIKQQVAQKNNWKVKLQANFCKNIHLITSFMSIISTKTLFYNTSDITCHCSQNTSALKYMKQADLCNKQVDTNDLM